MKEKDFSKISVKNNICINLFGYENGLVSPIYFSDQKVEDSMDLLLLVDDDKSHYVCIKDFNRFMFRKTKNKSKKCENVLIKHIEKCLSINCKQSVKIEKGIIESENYFKQIPVPYKIYADFECNLKDVKSYEGSYTKKIQDHIPCSFA